MQPETQNSAKTTADLVEENAELQRRIRDLEQLHQASEARFETLVGGSVQGVLIHKKFEPLFVNHTGAKIFGYESPEQVMALPSLLRLVAPSQRGHIQELGVRRRRGDAVPDVYEIECLKRDGSAIWVDHIGSAIDWFGEPATLSILVDITRRKKLDRLKNEFVSTVSHELRTPLTSIRGSLGLIVGGAVGEVSASARELLDIADNNCKRLIGLVNDILDMEKIESGRMEYKFDIVDLSSLVAEMIRANQAYGEEFDVTFVSDGAQPEARVQGDRERLSQVLANLLSNGAKFSPRGEKVEISVTRNDDYWRVAVKDKGNGVPEAFRDHVFEKFSQADGSDTSQIGGTGLGLSISRAIVEKHGGHISFDSEAGKGATFYFDLPIWQAPDAA